MSNLAIVQDGFNKDDPLGTLKLVTKPIPKPAPGQVVVHIKLRPINPTDFITLRAGRAENATAGSEGYGVIHEVGDGETKLRKGQRVIPMIGLEARRGNGSFQKYIAIDANSVLPAPDDLPDEAAAQFIVNPWTSYFMFKDLQVPKGEYMIQSAAGSALGKQVITLAKHWGIKTINVVRRAEQKAELKSLGADEVICSTDEDVVTRAKEITGGKGAWGALDAVGGTMTQTLAACVRDEGQLFLYGFLSGASTILNPMDLFRGVSVTGWSLYRKVLGSNFEAIAAEIAPLVRDGIIPVAKVERFDLTDFEQAFAKAAQPARSSKVLLVSE